MSCHALLRGSYREHPKDSMPAGMPDSNEIVDLTVILRRRQVPDSHSFGRTSHLELEVQYGAGPADIEAVEKFAAEIGVAVRAVNVGSRSITITGPLGMLAEAFGTELEMRDIRGRKVRTREGHLSLPANLEGRVVAVLGLDNRKVARRKDAHNTAASVPTCYTPRQVAQLYNFPTNTGAKQTIALIELGGGFRPADLKQYWKQLGIADVNTTAVSVDGAQNRPKGDPDSDDGDVVLDIEVAGAIAPGAKIVVYFAANTDQGFLDALNAAIHDKVRKPSVVSISWGGPENEWTSQALNAFNSALHDAAMLGVTVCVASGDDGSSEGESDGRDHVDFPASSPWALACGGTRLLAEGNNIQSETVWNNGTNDGATGGGISAFFTKPAYQSGIQLPTPAGTKNSTGRGVPDVAGVADPETGYSTLVDGKEGVVGGTSAVAPMWAGLVALLNEQLGKNVGFLNAQLYGTLAQHKTLRDIVTGTNGDFKAAVGWDASTGLGSPNGQAILAVLKGNSKK